MKAFLKKNWFFIFIAATITGVMISLNILFKYSKALEAFLGDDLYWQDSSFSFDSITGDNGRYLGNILVLIISKVDWLRVIIGIAASVALIYVLSLNAKCDRGVALAAAAALFFAIPSAMFDETVGWMSGFANYVPASIVVVLIAVVFKREFTDEPLYGKATPCLTAALGVVGALFIETVAIGNVIIGVALIIYHSVRFKKPCAAIIAFLIGAVVGAVLVFVNPVYLSVFKGEDPENYREVAISLGAMVNMYCEQFQYYFIFNNFWLNLCVVGMFAWIFIREFTNLKIAARIIAIICLTVQTLYLAESAIEKTGLISVENSFGVNAIKGVFTFLFCLGILLEVIFLLKNINLKLNCLCILGCVLVYTLPLLAVTLENTMATRPFVFAYLLLAAMVLMLLDGNIKESGVYAKRVELCVACFSTAAIVAFAAADIVKYYPRVDWLNDLADICVRF